ncbi:Hypothetical protein FKW44_006907 [Caligus rogercresseyi]|uniref:Uncharacterized protein n=1 Tax=Caligus rogercresseyi TaxID=217165 RepID=A0A7T8KE11_CALRO|nr:Hypothetical protein FKW44_006907 [Caligus rogercresseyi]
METMQDTVSKVRESIVSFVEDLKVFGQEGFMDDDFSWPMAKKEDIKESLEVQLVKEDSSWYIQRGKDREFIRNQGVDGGLLDALLAFISGTTDLFGAWKSSCQINEYIIAL